MFYFLFYFYGQWSQRQPGPSPAPTPQRLQRGRHPQTPQLRDVPGTRRKRRRKRRKRRRKRRPSPEPCARCRRRTRSSAAGARRRLRAAIAMVRAGGAALLALPFISLPFLPFPSRRGKPGRSRKRPGSLCAHAGLSRGAGSVPPAAAFSPDCRRRGAKRVQLAHGAYGGSPGCPGRFISPPRSQTPIKRCTEVSVHSSLLPAFALRAYGSAFKHTA